MHVYTCMYGISTCKHNEPTAGNSSCDVTSPGNARSRVLAEDVVGNRIFVGAHFSLTNKVGDRIVGDRVVGDRIVWGKMVVERGCVTGGIVEVREACNGGGWMRVEACRGYTGISNS